MKFRTEYDDVNDADRLGRDPAMRWIVGGHAIKGRAASTSQVGRFETELLATDENFAALTALSGVRLTRTRETGAEPKPWSMRRALDMGSAPGAVST